MNVRLLFQGLLVKGDKISEIRELGNYGREESFARLTPVSGGYNKKTWCQTILLAPRLEAFFAMQSIFDDDALSGNPVKKQSRRPAPMYIAIPYILQSECVDLNIPDQGLLHLLRPVITFDSCEVSRHQNRSVIVTLYVIFKPS